MTVFMPAAFVRDLPARRPSSVGTELGGNESPGEVASGVCE